MMGSVLKKRRLMPDLVVSSPANRAAMTARIIAASLKYPLENIEYNEALYEISTPGLIRVVKQIDDEVDGAMVVGHNPSITGMANYIADQSIGNVPTCGIYCVALDLSSWADITERCGDPKFFEFPKKPIA